MEDVSCTIRRAVPADAGPLADLAVRTFRDAFEANNSPTSVAEYIADSYHPARFLADIASPDVVTLLVVGDGLIAFAQVRRGDAPACVTATRPIELWRFYVDKAWHGRGVAQRLMRATLAEAAGASAVWLGVWEHNPQAIAFYRKCGFVDVGAKAFYLGSEVQTDRVMVLAREAATSGPG